jgi:hypothetical protein
MAMPVTAMMMVMPSMSFHLAAVMTQFVLVMSQFAEIAGNRLPVISHFAAVAVTVPAVFIRCWKLCL